MPAAPEPRNSTRCRRSGVPVARAPAISAATPTAAVPWMSSLKLVSTLR